MSSLQSSGPRVASHLRVEGLHHHYGDTTVLHGVDLSIDAGECLTLLGPSGCGKTTLLRSIAGLERPLAGQVEIAGQVMSSAGTDVKAVWVPPERRRIGMVFQEWALFPHMSVADNVGYGLERADRSGPMVAEALDLVGLGDLGDRMPHTLSGGQQQRVALARALAPRPRVLLLDEPFSNLDTSLRLEVRTEVHRLLHELEITSVFVTHDQEEAFVLGDRVAVMNDGEIRQVGTPQQVYHRPEDRWVAEFVGSVSVLRGEAIAGSVNTIVGPVSVDADLVGEVDVVVRPEHLALAGVGDATSAIAEVELVEFYGHDAMVFVSLNGHRLQVRTGPMVDVKRGDQVGLRFVGGAASAFPPVPVPAN